MSIATRIIRYFHEAAEAHEVSKLKTAIKVAALHDILKAVGALAPVAVDMLTRWLAPETAAKDEAAATAVINALRKEQTGDPHHLRSICPRCAVTAPSDTAARGDVMHSETRSPEPPPYHPEPSIRLDLDDGLIAYRASTPVIVPPGQNKVICFGVPTVVPKTGFPDLPETMQMRFGVTENFKPEKITVSTGFSLLGMFCGGDNAFPDAPSHPVHHDYHI